jgi:RNA 2',3'-cyclic 3'-phosphodiesterase
VSDDVRHRLFTALEVREPARAALDRVVAPLREAHPALRWTEPPTWHVTLAFVGGVPADRVGLVDAATARAAAGTSLLDLRLTGTFSSFGGSVLYAAVERSDPLMGLAARLHAELRGEGFDLEDRPYVPHCTLARVPRGCRAQRSRGPLDGPGGAGRPLAPARRRGGARDAVSPPPVGRPGERGDACLISERPFGMMVAHR